MSHNFINHESYKNIIKDDKGSVMLLSDLTDGTKDVNKRLG